MNIETLVQRKRRKARRRARRVYPRFLHRSRNNYASPRGFIGGDIWTDVRGSPPSVASDKRIPRSFGKTELGVVRVDARQWMASSNLFRGTFLGHTPSDRRDNVESVLRFISIPSVPVLIWHARREISRRRTIRRPLSGDRSILAE